MKLRDLIAELNVLEVTADPDTEVTLITSDSRKVEKGAGFVCLVGLRFDGHIWIDSALENGASVIFCQIRPRQKIPYVLLSDTRAALPLLLSAFYGHPEKTFDRIIGITGTNGKTTTSFLLKAVYEKAGHVTGLIGTTKYLVGDEEYKTDASAAFLTTPDPELLFELFDAMRQKHVDTVIMETSSHALHLKKLEGVPFTYGIFTNLTQDHLDFHKTMEEYLLAKKKLFQTAPVGFFNADDPYSKEISTGVSCRCLYYGTKENADYRVSTILEENEHGVSYELTFDGKKETVTLPMPGHFNVFNSCAAAALALYDGIAPETILAAFGKMEGVRGRIEKLPTNTPYSVFIDFAHTPDALENILKTLRRFTKGKLVTLFGCGGDRDRTKRPLMGKIAASLSDRVIVTSDNSRTEEKEDIIRDILAGLENTETEYTVVTDRTEAIHYALDTAREGDVILLAGKGHEEYEIDKTGKHPYSERNVVLAYLGEKK